MGYRHVCLCGLASGLVLFARDTTGNNNHTDAAYATREASDPTTWPSLTVTFSETVNPGPQTTTTR